MTEETLGYIYSESDTGWEFITFEGNSIRTRSSEKSDPFRPPLDQIRKNTVFLMTTEIRPGQVDIRCSEAPIERYKEISENPNIQKKIGNLPLKLMGFDGDPIMRMRERISELREIKIDRLI